MGLARWLEFLHKIGLTNLSDEQVNLYVEHSVQSNSRQISRDLDKVVLTVSQLGTIEGETKGLSKVIIIANKIEDPTEDTSSQLLKSVKKNFLGGVKYHFFISPSNMHQRDSYFKIYEGYATALVQEKKVNLSIEELVSIKPLSLEWKTYPYIFYVYEDVEVSGEYSTIGFRGTEEREGIAISYRYLDSEIASTILSLAMKANPSLEMEIVNAFGGPIRFASKDDARKVIVTKISA